MKARILFAIGFSTFGLTACQHNINQSSPTQNSQTLETIENLNTFPSTEGNTAKLSKTSKGCTVEFNGFYETGKATEYWTFKGKQLLSANTTIVHYANGGLSNPKNLNQPIEVASQQNKAFDIHDADTQKNFLKLLNNFKSRSLAQCQ